jgi:tryptophan-rich sensory protein
MKPIIAKLIAVAPIIAVIVIVAYIIEELVEDFFSEMLSDFVYPITGIIILAILWIKVIPTIQAYLHEDPEKSPGDLG